MLYPTLELKTVLLENAVESFKEDLRKIWALITVGYIPGTSNLGRPHKDPIAVINSSIYRHGPVVFGSKEALGKDIVATCKAGLPASSQTHQRRRSARVARKKRDVPWYVQTKAMKAVERARVTFTKWMHYDRSSGEGDNSENLLDHHHQFKLKTVLSRKVYNRWSSKFFPLVKMLRAAYMLASLKLYMATHMEVRREALGMGILLRSSQLHYPIGVKKLADAEIHRIKVTNLRLDSHTARSLYGTKYIPVLGKEDPIKFKAMRRAHMWRT